MRTVLIPVALLLAAATSFGQVDPTPDSLGIYFDQGATQFCRATSAPFESVFAYLCLTNPTCMDISGWEAIVRHEGDSPVSPAWGLPTPSVDVNPDPEIFQVGISTLMPVLPTSPIAVLATWNGFVAGPDDVIEFYVEGLQAQETPYYSCPDALDPIMCQVPTPFGPGGPCAMIAPDSICLPLANDEATFTTLKSLYR